MLCCAQANWMCVYLGLEFIQLKTLAASNTHHQWIKDLSAHQVPPMGYTEGLPALSPLTYGCSSSSDISDMSAGIEARLGGARIHQPLVIELH